ncbi:TSUP family transporter [Acidovorax sp.]|uniref:TSUP family transporter n=1 Tax=Acidovorax sp. TaxID=1872122 RepID=UPI002ACE1481|nr:TSUP family transporter [Acidovorax sp.]MDZ7863111.1 TSUP family transporter [Acidovorax sp.]
MTTSHLLAAAAILALAGFAHGLFGIGFAMIATPLLALFLDYRLAVALAAFPLLAMAVGWLVVHVRSRSALAGQRWLLPGIAIGAAAGTLLQVSLPERTSIALLALLLSASLAVPWLATRGAALRPAAAQRGAPVFGVLAGMTESALNVGAPFMLLYGSLARLGRFEQLIALNVCFALGKGIQLALTAWSWPAAASGVALLVCTTASLAAYFAGHRLAGRFDEARFRRLLRNFIVCMVAGLLVRVWLLA